jgi:6-phosphogluconate dehydrogenase (decarboxylating)
MAYFLYKLIDTEMTPLLGTGDIVIEAGNSHYNDRKFIWSMFFRKVK